MRLLLLLLLLSYNPYFSMFAIFVGTFYFYNKIIGSHVQKKSLLTHDFLSSLKVGSSGFIEQNLTNL